MSAWESNASDDGFETETGSPEIAETSGPVSPSPPTPAVPGLVGVASISLAPPPPTDGVCRCRACRNVSEDFDAWFA